MGCVLTNIVSCLVQDLIHFEMGVDK
jgi:hypothetical protein